MRLFSSSAGSQPAESLQHRSPIASTAKIVGMFLAAIAIGLLGTGGTYAYLNAFAAASPSGVVKAGTASLTVSNGTISLTNLYPGETRTGTFQVTNSGDVNLALSVASISGPTAANGLTATVSRANCAAAQQGANGSLGVIGKKGGSIDVCLTVKMPVSAPDTARTSGQTTVTVVISGMQS